MSFQVIPEVVIEMNECVTWGITKDKYGKVSVPVDLDENAKKTVKSLIKKHEANNKVYVNTIYLKCDDLNDEQTEGLLNKGCKLIRIMFKATGIYVVDDRRYVTFEIVKLSKLDKETKRRVPESY